LGQRAAARQRAAREELEAAQARAEALEDPRDLRVGREVDEDAVEAVVGGVRVLGVAAPQRRLMLVVARPQHAVVLDLHPRDGLLGRERVQRGEHREERARVGGAHGRHARVALGGRLHEPVVLEPGERAADRRAAQPEPRAQLLVVQHLPRYERPRDDRVAQGVIRGVAQEVALDRVPLVGDWHFRRQ
jgi:hypothetical protein